MLVPRLFIRARLGSKVEFGPASLARGDIAMSMNAEFESAGERDSLASFIAGRERDARSAAANLDRRLSAGCKARRIRSKGARLVLLWSIAGYIAFALFPDESPLSTLQPFEGFQYVLEAVMLLIPVLSSPLAGLLGDVYFGRHNVLRCAVIMMWTASVLYTIVLLVEYLYPSTATALNYSVLALAHIVFGVGENGFQVLIILFGVDQLPDASTEEISAFLHWLVWTWFLGLCIGNMGSLVYGCLESPVPSLSLLVCVLMISFVLCSDFWLCGRWLVIEPRCRSPIKHIANVLKYALKHKYPVRRSALTYWEDAIPSRVDLGKMKYGGPFTNEQVEDVKTFFRVIVVTVCILAFVIPRTATQIAVIQSVHHYKQSSITGSCYSSFGVFVLILGVIFIPIYEFLVYPFARNWIPSSLKRVVIFALLTVAVGFYLMLVELVGHSQSDADIPCMFHDNETSLSVPIYYGAVEVPTGAVIAVQWLAFDIAAFEFICAQSPYNMKGLLTGFGVVAIVLARVVGEIVYEVWSGAWTVTNSFISCGAWYYIFTCLIGILGLILLFIVAKWYKRRERDDIINEQRFVEAYYTTLTESQY